MSEHFDLWIPNKEIVVTEKLDGENTSMLNDRFHVRSEDSLSHNSQSYARHRWGQIRHLLPENMQFVFENVYAKHSIYYDELTDFIYLIGVFDLSKGIVLSYDEMILWAEELEVEVAPVLYRGPLADWVPFLPEKSAFGKEIEGYVARKTNEFLADEFHIHVAKYVRKGHVQTDKHWKRTWIPNKLRIE